VLYNRKEVRLRDRSNSCDSNKSTGIIVIFTQEKKKDAGIKALMKPRPAWGVKKAG